MANERDPPQQTSDSSLSAGDLRQIVDCVPGFVFTCAPGGELEFVNTRALAYFGRVSQRSQIVHPDDLERAKVAWQKDIAAGQAHCSELRLRGSDAGFRWFQLRASPIRDVDGQVSRWFGALTDIEDLKLARDSARNAERAVKLVLDSLPALVFMTKATGELDWVNRNVLAYFGRSLAELRQWEMADSVHPEDVPSTIEHWSRGLASGEPYEFEQRLRRFDGAYRWFHFRAAPIRDDRGELARWCGLVTDVDDLHRAKEAARLSERDLRLLVDNVPGLVYTMTPECELGVVNRQLLEYFGKSREELQEWEAAGCVHPDDLPLVRASLKRTVEYGEPHEVEQRLRRADGTYRWFKPRGLPERNAEGRIERWYCLLYDIEDLKRAEEDQRTLQARLSRASHAATISELAATIAHEVKQPIASVVANAEACHGWLSASPPNIGRALGCAERIVRDGHSADDVVSRIRLLFRRAPPVKVPLDLNEVIAEVCDLVADDLRAAGVLVTLDLQLSLPVVAADRVQMLQVLVNLTRNGIEAMEGAASGAKQLSIASFELDDEVTVQVTDVGAGVSDLDAVFEPFYTTKASGMGVGLTICRSILEAHGGRLWARVNPSLGTTFGVVLRTLASETESAVQ